MRARTRSSRAILWLLLGVATPVVAQLPAPSITPSTPPAALAVLAGKVIDDDTGAPLSGVNVTIVGTSLVVVSDARGQFAIVTRRSADVDLLLRRIGYRTTSVTTRLSVGDTTRVAFFLRPLTPTLDTVSVAAPAMPQSARLADFDRRRNQHINGVFLTRTDIEKRRAVRSISLLYGIPGIRVIDSAGIKLIVSARGDIPKTRREYRDQLGMRHVDYGFDLAPCYLALGVDGVVQPWGVSVDQLPVGDIEGIEIYQGASSIPRELMSSISSFCGLVMVWTRSGS